VFNRVVGARLAGAPAGPALGTLLEGDLAWRHAGGAVFRVEDPAREQPRADAFEISPSGPLFGRRMTRPAGEPDRLEQAVLAEEGQTLEDFLRPGPLQWQGARRPLRVPLGEHGLSAEEDEHGPFLALDFTLPAGAYATAVLREVAKDR
jgi:tRNA pseudouridine13 synthase